MTGRVDAARRRPGCSDFLRWRRTRPIGRNGTINPPLTDATMYLLLTVCLTLTPGRHSLEPVSLNICSATDAKGCAEEWRRCVSSCSSDATMPMTTCVEWCNVVQKQCRENIGCPD